MCGILLNIFRNVNDNVCSKKFKKLLCNRGPNSCNEVENYIGNGWNCFMLASILWTQGDKITVQPIRNSNGSFLLWNGDIYSGLPERDDSCDSALVFEQLTLKEDVLTTFSKLCGPYAFIYFDADKNTLWFGRDPVGRHSLLWKINSENLMLASVCPRNVDLEEIPNCGIFKIDLSKPILEVYLHPWNHLSVDHIHLGIPFKLDNKLSHSCLTSPLDYYWINKEPESQQIEFLKDFSNNMDPSTIFEYILSDNQLFNIVQRIKHLLIQSVERRIKTKPNYCSSCISSLTQCVHSKIGILFSGGLDSTILAVLSHQILPLNESIDLYNVAFDRDGTKADGFLVPDRKNGFESLKDLSLLFPQRKWNFIEINVSKEELAEHRAQHIADLIHPLKSILDDSLGCALWFAARGKGMLNNHSYESPARIVLLGMGADEIFGGYSRHRKEFGRYGWSRLGLQLIEEINNIGKRNLGRDNRIVTDHGRQPRLPFLDENFLEYALSLPPWHRCYLASNLNCGIGDKLLLRSLAWDLGLRYCSILPKKAMQFGSKIANPKEKGHELSIHLVNR